jgi:serine/threonine protein kinase
VLKNGQYSTKSDVWSFGVVMWEIFECGALPYGKWRSNADVVDEVLQGKTLEKPSNCPSEVFEIMTQCWKKVNSIF